MGYINFGDKSKAIEKASGIKGTKFGGKKKKKKVTKRKKKS
jgi:hypothetical protein